MCKSWSCPDNSLSEIGLKMRNKRSVTFLNLSNNNFAKFPPEICTMPSLQVLHFVQNNGTKVSETNSFKVIYLTSRRGFLKELFKTGLVKESFVSLVSCFWLFFHLRQNLSGITPLMRGLTFTSSLEGDYESTIKQYEHYQTFSWV